MYCTQSAEVFARHFEFVYAAPELHHPLASICILVTFGVTCQFKVFKHCMGKVQAGGALDMISTR